MVNCESERLLTIYQINSQKKVYKTERKQICVKHGAEMNREGRPRAGIAGSPSSAAPRWGTAVPGAVGLAWFYEPEELVLRKDSQDQPRSHPPETLRP